MGFNRFFASWEKPVQTVPTTHATLPLLVLIEDKVTFMSPMVCGMKFTKIGYTWDPVFSLYIPRNATSRFEAKRLVSASGDD